MTNATFIRCITVTDPDSHTEVELELYKDEQSGAIFALDSSYLKQITEIPSPFQKFSMIKLIDRHKYVVE